MSGATTAQSCVHCCEVAGREFDTQIQRERVSNQAGAGIACPPNAGPAKAVVERLA